MLIACKYKRNCRWLVFLMRREGGSFRAGYKTQRQLNIIHTYQSYACGNRNDGRMRGGQRHHRATWTSECGLDDQLFSLFFPNQGEPKERSVGMDFWISAIKSHFHFSLEIPMMPLRVTSKEIRARTRRIPGLRGEPRKVASHSAYTNTSGKRRPPLLIFLLGEDTRCIHRQLPTA